VMDIIKESRKDKESTQTKPEVEKEESTE